MPKTLTITITDDEKLFLDFGGMPSHEVFGVLHYAELLVRYEQIDKWSSRSTVASKPSRKKVNKETTK